MAPADTRFCTSGMKEIKKRETQKTESRHEKLRDTTGSRFPRRHRFFKSSFVVPCRHTMSRGSQPPCATSV